MTAHARSRRTHHIVENIYSSRPIPRQINPFARQTRSKNRDIQPGDNAQYGKTISSSKGCVGNLQLFTGKSFGAFCRLLMISTVVLWESKVGITHDPQGQIGKVVRRGRYLCPVRYKGGSRVTLFPTRAPAIFGRSRLLRVLEF